MTKISTIVLSIVALSGVAFAAPAPAPLLEEVDWTKIVIPGPGLPSVASLGLTSRDLQREPEDMAIKRDLTKRTQCEGEVCQYANALACYNYLLNLGRQACVVPPNGSSKFCQAAQCNWFGFAVPQGASSYCSDVAIGGKTAIDTCNRGGFTAGQNAANGNGNLQVAIFSTA